MEIVVYVSRIAFTVLVGSLSPVSSSSLTHQIIGASDLSIVEALAPELQRPEIATLTEGDRDPRAVGRADVRFEGDFNADGELDLILVGHYLVDNQRGSFVLIARSEAGAWERTRLFTFDTDTIIGKAYETRPGDIAVFF